MTEPEHEPAVSKRAYQLVAVATLPLAFLGAYVLGRPVADSIPSETSIDSLLTLLAYLVALLVCVVVWAALLMPLRRRAGFKPVAEEIADMQAAGGFGAAMAKEQQALALRAAENDPSYHATLALVGVLLSGASAALTWALWNDGYVMLLAAVGAVVCPVVALYHTVQWLRFR